MSNPWKWLYERNVSTIWKKSYWCFQGYVREHDNYKDNQEAIMRNA